MMGPRRQLRIGAFTSMPRSQRIAHRAAIGLAAATYGLATPQVRHLATLGAASRSIQLLVFSQSASPA